MVHEYNVSQEFLNKVGFMLQRTNTLTVTVQISETHEPVPDSKTKEKAHNKITAICENKITMVKV